MPRTRRSGLVAPPRRHERRTRAAWLLIIVVGAAAYANSVRGPFIFDDKRAILDNVSIRQISTSFHPDAQTPLAGRPLANLSFAVNYALGDRAVDGYHVVNIAIHLLAALTLFGVLRRLLRPAESEDDRRTGPPVGMSAADGMALASTMIWLVHP